MKTQNFNLNASLNFNLIINLNTNKKCNLITNPRINKFVFQGACKARVTSRSHVGDGDGVWGSAKGSCSVNARSACFGCAEDDS